MYHLAQPLLMPTLGATLVSDLHPHHTLSLKSCLILSSRAMDRLHWQSPGHQRHQDLRPPGQAGDLPNPVI